MSHTDDGLPAPKRKPIKSERTPLRATIMPDHPAMDSRSSPGSSPELCYFPSLIHLEAQSRAEIESSVSNLCIVPRELLYTTTAAQLTEIAYLLFGPISSLDWKLIDRRMADFAGMSL